MTDDLADLVLTVADYLKAWGYEIPDELKTVDWYQRTLWRNVRLLYNMEINAQMFINSMVDLISDQLRRAWNEGMRANGLDPARDMEPEWESRLQDIMLNELNYVEDFANRIPIAAINGESWDQFKPRVAAWANRYNDVVQESKITTALDKKRFRWVYGDTDHCDTCAKLNGIVATADQWRASGLQPGNPPNPQLICGGWRCQCQFVETKDKVTGGGIPAV